MITLPQIMVAPTGARRTKADHPMLPISADEIVATARECQRAGAGAIHLHIRDGQGRHLLDAASYRHVMDRVAEAAPGMLVQISTEAVGIYTPEQQRQVVRDLRPAAISIALRELAPREDGEADAAAFYGWCAAADIAVQHILYDANDVARLARMVARGAVEARALSLLFVLGRYSANQESIVDDLAPFLAAATSFPAAPEWMVCAFGTGETACLAAALAAGGKVRVGFENSLWHADGSLAQDNQSRVAVIAHIADTLASSLRQGAARS